MRAFTSTPALGISLKLISILFFVAMVTCLKLTQTMPVGQLVFGRSFFALIPLFMFLAWRGELKEGLKTRRPFAHILRATLGALAMICGFTAITRLPLPDATAIGFANPLFAVVLGALVLRENVRIFRWSAVLIGLLGVMIIVWPRVTVLSDPQNLDVSEAIGAGAALLSALLAATAALAIRNLLPTERTATIAIYFACFTSVLGLATIPFGWTWPSTSESILLIGAGIFGGIGQILLTESFRHAPLSTIAPFEYSAIIWTTIVGYLIFSDIPTWNMVIGALITICAGLFVIWRDHQRGVDRTQQRKNSLPQN